MLNRTTRFFNRDLKSDSLFLLQAGISNLPSDGISARVDDFWLDVQDLVLHHLQKLKQALTFIDHFFIDHPPQPSRSRLLY